MGWVLVDDEGATYLSLEQAKALNGHPGLAWQVSPGLDEDELEQELELAFAQLESLH